MDFLEGDDKLISLLFGPWDVSVRIQFGNAIDWAQMNMYMGHGKTFDSNPNSLCARDNLQIKGRPAIATASNYCSF